MTTRTSRPLRADAQRNRDAILGAALAIFDAEGIFAPIDGIAIAAGVGNATLYRNFPTRNDLLAAVIEKTIVELVDGSTELEREMSPDDALREWLQRVAWHLRIWNDLPTCIASSIEDATSPVQDVATRLTNRTRYFLDRAKADGSASDSVTADELFEMVTAISWAIDRFGDDRQRARARVDLAIAGAFQSR